MKTNEKLRALRELMQQKGIDAWIIPSGDPHQSEYVASHWKSRSWISGFTGSAGVCVVTMDKAGLWTDSRYWIQAARQLSGSDIELYKMFSPGVPDFRNWLADELAKGATLGFDGSLLSVREVALLDKMLGFKKVKFHYNEDMISPIWTDRPEIPAGEAKILLEDFSGESVSSKISRVREQLVKQRLDYHIISALDEIAWLFNIRGTDIAYNPVVISYAFLSKDDACLFIDNSKLNSDTKAELEKSGVKFFPYNNVFEFLSLMPESKKLLLDPEKVSLKLKEAINCEAVEGKSIITILKSVKNEIEQEGFRMAHIQDGVSLVRFFYWLDNNVGKVELDEYSLGNILHEFRNSGENFMGDSFNPIVGYKGNGAIVHYSAEAETAAKIDAEGILLIDSGGQYLTGTTDITRTITLGKVTEEEKRYFTLVLAGHIELALAKFPKNSSGAMLDTYTRTALWKEGMDYGHGTGHGVGHFLGVHEGPQGISGKNYHPMLIGSVTTNEPGMYLEGKFGIRTENVMICQLAETTQYGDFCEFETITMCPIDLKLIDKELLSNAQITWLNEYHQEIFEKLSPFLEENELLWLKEHTRKI